MTAWRLSAGFVAGFLAVLVFHQGTVALLHAAGIVPFAPWQFRPVPPLGVPQVISAAFWGGLWGVAYAAAEPWFSRRFGRWPGAFLFFAILPPLAVLFVVAPLKGAGITAASFALPRLAVLVLIHAVWGLGTALFLWLGLKLRPTRRTDAA